MNWFVEEKFSLGHVALLSRWGIKYIVANVKMGFEGCGVRSRFGSYPKRY